MLLGGVLWLGASQLILLHVRTAVRCTKWSGSKLVRKQRTES